MGSFPTPTPTPRSLLPVFSLLCTLDTWAEWCRQVPLQGEILFQLCLSLCNFNIPWVIVLLWAQLWMTRGPMELQSYPSSSGAQQRGDPGSGPLPALKLKVVSFQGISWGDLLPATKGRVTSPCPPYCLSWELLHFSAGTCPAFLFYTAPSPPCCLLPWGLWQIKFWRPSLNMLQAASVGAFTTNVIITLELSK